MSAANRGSERISQDSYYTPIWVVDLIMSKIKSNEVVSSLEPCKGDGRIYDRMPGSQCKHWCEIQDGRDYLATSFSSIDLIITNPPFSMALQFLSKSLLEAQTVVYLLRLNFLGSATRKEFWSSNPPSHLYVLSKRPSFVNGRTDATEYAWFVWDKAKLIIDNPGIYVI